VVLIQVLDSCTEWNRELWPLNEKYYDRANVQYRPLDTLTNFQMGKTSGVTPAPVRYSIRQVLDQELQKEKLLQNSAARQARSTLLDRSGVHTTNDDNKENADAAVGKETKAKIAQAGAKRDFFGRIINNSRPTSAGKRVTAQKEALMKMDKERVWISFNEGYSNAVRKPITLKELMESFE
jgi:chromosome transmission fidelity protein 18